jgi:hypothetical protein
MRPLERDADPSPDFIARAMPCILPTLAPVPAPTFPCTTLLDDAARHARRAMAGVGRARGLPADRSNRIAAGTIGTMASRTL